MPSIPLVLPDTPENRELAANIHPPDWINPEPAGLHPPAASGNKKERVPGGPLSIRVSYENFTAPI